MSREKKVLILLWTYVILFFVPKLKSKDNRTNIIYNEDYISTETPYAKYKDKNIYIIDADTAKELDTNTDDIYIIDDRLDDDPDMSICDSYKYKSITDIDNILNLLLEYENKDPSEWNRSFDSMKKEWLIHNICHLLNIQKNRTEQVDFNNADEETYLDILKMLREMINTNATELEKIKTLTKKS